MAEGDIVHYLDSGCWLNSAGLERMKDYVEMCNSANNGIVAFQVPEHPIEELEWYRLPEKRWTKRYVLEKFGVYNNTEVMESNQIEATTLFIKKNSESMRIIKEWRDLFIADVKMINDAPSDSIEHPEFIEHRHDQSVLSLLLKKYGCTTISSFEMYWPIKLEQTCDSLQWGASWEKLAKFPIQARRDKDYGPYVRTMERLNVIAKIGKMLGAQIIKCDFRKITNILMNLNKIFSSKNKAKALEHLLKGER
jgi:hypothetical protein